MKTNQEIFDTVAFHLIRQGRPAKAQTACRYRTAEGDKCAVGCLLTEYDENIEGIAVNNPTPLLLLLLEKSGVDARDLKTNNLLHFLQRAHDNGYTGSFTDTVYERLKCIAGRFELSTAELDKLFAEHRLKANSTGA